MKTLSIIKGQGKKSSWMFLCEGDYGDVIKSFKSGKLEDVKTYLSKRYLNFILGEIKGHGVLRHRMVYVTELTRVQKIERKETESERMLANAQSAHTQLKAWAWEGLK